MYDICFKGTTSQVNIYLMVDRSARADLLMCFTESYKVKGIDGFIVFLSMNNNDQRTYF